MLARDCLDWTERKPPLAGAPLARCIHGGGLERRRSDRGLTITELGQAHPPNRFWGADSTATPAGEGRSAFFGA